MINERGEHFSIKHMPYQDTDTFTPTQVGSGLDPLWYYNSRREACVVNLSRPQTGCVYNSSNTLIDGALVHPLSYPAQIAFQPCWHESWFESIRSTLFYPPSAGAGAGSDTTMGSYGVPLTRTQFLGDVAQPEISMYLQGRDNEPNLTGWYNAPAYRTAPGNELKSELAYNDYIHDQYSRMHIGGMNVMDFNVAYWNDVDQKFYNLDDYMGAYFSPPPKALRLTITVCDSLKRKRVTMSRVVQVPESRGIGVVYNMGGAADVVLPVQPSLREFQSPVPLVQTYNRVKDLRVLTLGSGGPLLEPQIQSP